MNARDDLKRELDGLAIKDEEDLLSFLPRAARLAAAGDRTHLDKWPEWAKPFDDRLEDLLVRRAHEGLWDLRHALGEQLGFSVVEAQDFACLRQLVQLPPAAVEAIDAWTEEAERAPIDEDAVEILERYRAAYDLAEEFRLAIVEAPISLTDKAFLAATGKMPSVVTIRSAIATAAKVEEPALDEFAMLDGATAPEVHRRVYERRDVPFALAGRGTMKISRRLHEDWTVVIEVARTDDAPEPSFVQVGVLPARPVAATPTGAARWLLELGLLPSKLRHRALRESLMLTFAEGDAVRIEVDGWGPHRP